MFAGILRLLDRRAPVASATVAPPARPWPPGLGSKVLRLKAAGPDVAWLQARVGENPDGIFGFKTRDAVVAFQIEQGVLGDGVVGPTTWRKLGVALPSAPAVFVPPLLGAPDVRSSAQRWAGMLRAVRAPDPDGWGAVLAEQCAGEVESPDDRSGFLSNGLVETATLSRLVENLYYITPGQIQKTWKTRFPTVDSEIPYRRNPFGLGEKVYGGRMGNGPTGTGDGYKHRGHGFFCLTGKAQMLAQAALEGVTVDGLLERLTERGPAVRSAVRFWKQNRCAAALATGGVPKLRRVVNGADIGLADTEAFYATLLPAARG